MPESKTAHRMNPDADFDDDETLPDEAGQLDDLLGALPPALTWPEVGTEYVGIITDMQRAIQTNPTGEVRTFSDGTARPQGVITLQTDLSDDDDDDGTRRLFVKGAMVKAFRQAAKVAKVRGPRVGDRIEVRYTGDAEPTARGLNGAKQFEVTITPAPPRSASA